MTGVLTRLKAFRSSPARFTKGDRTSPERTGMIFLFSYDLTKKKTEFDYEVLWDELKRLDAHRVQESVWLVELDNTAKEVIEHFQSFVHSDDRLWASSVRAREHWYCKAMGGTNKWLEDHPPA